MASVARYQPGVDRFIVLADKVEGVSVQDEPAEIITIDQLGIDDFDEFVFRYNILELNTAVKPFAFRHLMDELGYQKVVYFDPDIRIYNSLDSVFDTLKNFQIVLTPHLTAPLLDDRRPDETDILKAGTYNLGFIALRDGEDARHMLSWWSAHLRQHCLVDVARGIFVDQKWIDLVPGFFQSVKIERNPGWNVAYWNMLNRTMTRADDGYQVNGEPLMFFHFSGIRAQQRIFSIHQDRFQYPTLPPVAKELVDDYIEQLQHNDRDGISSARYGYAEFDDGIAINDFMRYAYRRAAGPDVHAQQISLKTLQPWLIGLLNAPANLDGLESPFVTRLAYEVYKSREDLKTSFPDLKNGGDAAAFGSWFVNNAVREFRLPEVFVDSIRQALLSLQSRGGRRNSMREDGSRGPTFGQQIYIHYKGHPRLNTLVKRFTSSGLRGRIRQILLRRHTAPVPEQVPARNVVMHDKIAPGVNVIGYLYAESGTGEAVRSTLRAIQTTELQCSAIDVRYGNISRMGETPPLAVTQEQKYRVNLFHINADQAQVVHRELGHRFYDKHYNIGFWFWELADFPDSFNAAFEHLDEIWVASSFCQRAISLKSPVPVVHIPLCIELDVPGDVDRVSFGLPEDRFMFLSIMDIMSIPERKNPLAVLEAFSLAFHGRDDVFLVVKFSNAERCPPDIWQKIVAYKDRPNIHFIEDYLERNVLNALLNCADCYFSLHRSEGFGLPIAESMYLGKPVIATGWSSNMDFMTTSNSLPVQYRLIELDQDHGPYAKGNIWAEPKIDHAVECLRTIVSDDALRKRLSRNAEQDIRQYYSPATIGTRIAQRLQVIEKR